jgi:hypothetical protein
MKEANVDINRPTSEEQAADTPFYMSLLPRQQVSVVSFPSFLAPVGTVLRSTY